MAALFALAIDVANANVAINMVTVGDPGNAGELSGEGAGGTGTDRICGAVDYVYKIGKFEITNAQYCGFLNAVAADDLNNLFRQGMGAGYNSIGGITRHGVPGSYSYTIAPDRADRPVSNVSWENAVRFANWLHNGQPTGPQVRATTEDGAYDVTSLDGNDIRKPGALFFLPNADEWYKAAPPLSEMPPGRDMDDGSANFGGPRDWTKLTTVVGAYNSTDSEGEYVSDSAYGTFDQGGNVREWIETDTSSSAEQTRDTPGGSYATDVTSLHAAYSLAYGATPQNDALSLGFRIASVGDPTPASVLGRHILYLHSPVSVLDEDAVAPDKQALLPGETATFANYTSYDLGINGIIVDIAGLADADGLTHETIGEYLEFRVGSSSAVHEWNTAPSVRTVEVDAGQGADSSDRVTITWVDGTIQNEWLQVIVLANESTGLAEPDVFYFGNAIGEAGNSPDDAKVNATDMLLARNNPRSFVDPAPIDFPYDYNRDGRVNATDMLLARNNPTSFINDLNLITVPGVEAGGPQAVPEPGSVAMLLAGCLGLLGIAWRRRRA